MDTHHHLATAKGVTFDEAAYRDELIAVGLSAEEACAVAAKTGHVRREALDESKHRKILIDAGMGIAQAKLHAAAATRFNARPTDAKPAESVRVAGFQPVGGLIGKSMPTVKKVELLQTRISKGPKSTSRFDRLVEESLAIDAEAAKDAGALGFMARALTQATMPHKKTNELQFTRTNGDFKLTIATLGQHGLPYGSIPRLLMAWVTTEAVRTKSRELVLGKSLSDFMRELGIVPTGGRNGSITHLRDQMVRLFFSAVSASYSGDDRDKGKNYFFADEYDLWWHPKASDQTVLWESTLTLSEHFFKEVTQKPVPVDMRALKVLRQAPLALDIYVWLTYRLSYLKKKTDIPWKMLELQFGSEYKLTRQFRAAFVKHLNGVLVIYPEARAKPTETGLELRPSSPHVRKLR